MRPDVILDLKKRPTAPYTAVDWCISNQKMQKTEIFDGKLVFKYAEIDLCRECDFILGKQNSKSTRKFMATFFNVKQSFDLLLLPVQ